jgi:hypothetical protein
MNRLVQWGVVLGALWGLFVCVVGNWDTQGHAPCFVPEFWACVTVLVVVHVTAVWRLVRR